MFDMDGIPIDAPPTPEDYLHSTSPIPVLLHTCTESRLIAKKSGYALTFGTEKDNGRVWFNAKRDVLYLPQALLWQHRGFKLIRQVSIDPSQKPKRLAIKDDSLIGTDVIDEIVIINAFSDIEEYFAILGQHKRIPRDDANDPWVYVNFNVISLFSGSLNSGIEYFKTT